MVKKSIYAICGTAMITTVVVVRSLADGGLELAALLLIGALMLVLGVVLVLISMDNTLLRFGVIGRSMVARRSTRAIGVFHGKGVQHGPHHRCQPSRPSAR